MSTLILIPSRLASTRLPAKPLADIGGRPMIVRVAERARDAGIGRVVVAADDASIRDAVTAAGFEAVMTGSHHQSGSDRIFEALEALDPAGEVDTIINLQGDLPTIEPETIRAVLRPFDDPACDIATVAVEIGNAADRDDPSVVKLVAPRSARTASTRSISRAPPRRRARGRSITMSASTPIAARRSPASSR